MSKSITTPWEYPFDPKSVTLYEAQQWAFEKAKTSRGCLSPLCERPMKFRPEKLNVLHISVLERLLWWHTFYKQPWIHVENQCLQTRSQVHGFSVAKHWGANITSPNQGR